MSTAVELNPKVNVELTEAESELYDRQIRLWGLESQKRLRTAKILVSGLGGLGAEVTKNIILSGVNSVTLHDDKIAAEEDICSQFLIPREKIGQNRASASIERALKLNPMVHISAEVEALSKKQEDFFKQFDVVVIIGAPQAELIRIDNICRENKIKFFCGNVWGMFGYCFADLNKYSFYEDQIKHKLINVPGKKSKTELITTPVRKELCYPSLQSTEDYDYETEALQKRRRKAAGPSIIVLRILQKFRETHGRDPSYAERENDISRLEQIRDELTSDNVVPSSWFQVLFGEISPATAVVGGILAQEIIKVITEKDTPIYNVFFFDPQVGSGFVQFIGTK